MASLLNSALLGAAMVVGTMTFAHAQSNVAALPPSGALSATPPSYGTYPGPQPGNAWAGVGQQTMPVMPSPSTTEGPRPGAAAGLLPPKWDKPAGYDENVAMHPYTSNMGPRPH